MILPVKILVAIALSVASQLTNAAEPAQRGERLVQEARQIVGEIDKGRYESVEARFDRSMADALPLDKLTATSKAISQQAGALKSIGDATTSQKENFFIVLLPCEFADMKLDAQIVFDRDDKIAGMYFRPHPVAGGGMATLTPQQESVSMRASRRESVERIHEVAG